MQLFMIFFIMILLRLERSLSYDFCVSFYQYTKITAKDKDLLTLPASKTI